MGPVVTSPAAPEARTELSPPTLTATTRSRIPRRFHTTKTRLIAKPGRRTRARATQGAVTPMAMSPRPAGPREHPMGVQGQKPEPGGPPPLDRRRQEKVEGQDEHTEGGPTPVRAQKHKNWGRHSDEDGNRRRPGRPGHRPGGAEQENHHQPKGEHRADNPSHGSTPRSQERVLWSYAELGRSDWARDCVPDAARAVTPTPATSLALCKDSMANLAEGK